MSDTLRDYLNQIGKIPLLTAAEEIELGHAIQKMIAIQTDQPSKEEQRILRIGRRAKERMIKGNLRLGRRCQEIQAFDQSPDDA